LGSSRVVPEAQKAGGALTGGLSGKKYLNASKMW